VSAPLRERAALLDAYLRVLEGQPIPFTIPGHHRRAALLDAGLGRLLDADVPLYGGLDTVKLTKGSLAAAERATADYYGADWCRYSTGGSTQANQALCLALGRPGDKVIVTRSLHRSMLLGLVLAGLEPVWLPTEIHQPTGLPLGVALEDLRVALDAVPDAVAVALTEPGYLGTLSDLGALIELSHVRGLPVVVDQAWGGHLGVHPELPGHAMALGADALVTSTHKLLVGYSQASVLVARTQALDLGRLERGFDATQTTSPSGAILASSDASRALLETRGRALLETTLALVRQARARLAEALPGIGLPDERSLPRGRFDPTRLIIQTASLGADGVAVERALVEEGISFELADRDTLVPVLSIADGPESIDALLAALIPALDAHRGPARPFVSALSWRVEPVTAISPREAFFADHERIAAAQAVGRISAELVAPYPPGIPVLAPGELITAALLEGLVELAASGVRIAYAADPSLSSVEVVALPPG
jgi:lysine decarboxylase